ncbi:hypothetical protein GCM10023347_11040 [Streptomyces chumphonensis]|uniref:hypothetical protein n=1 Tax=Streptomyces chumphonensis TaxID=1214925 RepID=UPI0021E42D9D|nr:hypothetical protein [Streptomyces chumphonensis]
MDADTVGRRVLPAHGRGVLVVAASYGSHLTIGNVNHRALLPHVVGFAHPSP